MPTPEIPLDQQVSERPTEVFSETLNSVGAQAVPTNVKPVHDEAGVPLISTPASTGAKIQIPADENTLIAWSKGSITNAISWLGKFWLRIIKKQNANTTKPN